MIFADLMYVAMLQVTMSLPWMSITMVRLRDFIIAFGTHLTLPHYDCSCFSNSSSVAFACASFQHCWCEVLCSLYLPFAMFDGIFGEMSSAWVHLPFLRACTFGVCTCNCPRKGKHIVVHKWLITDLILDVHWYHPFMCYKSLCHYTGQSGHQVHHATEVQPSVCINIELITQVNTHFVQLCNDLIPEILPSHVSLGYEGMSVVALIDVNIKQPDFMCVSGKSFTQIECDIPPSLICLLG